jgi:ribosome-associated protein
MAVKRPVAAKTSSTRAVARKPSPTNGAATGKRVVAAVTARKPRAPVVAAAKPELRKVAAVRTGAKAARAAKARPTLKDVVLDALDDMKAVDVKALDVRGITDITDTMVVASGTSDRHVKSIADRVVQRCKEAGFRPYGMEGERDGEWVLLDLNDVVLHVMLPRIREFYALEKLWEASAAKRA